MKNLIILFSLLLVTTISSYAQFGPCLGPLTAVDSACKKVGSFSGITLTLDRDSLRPGKDSYHRDFFNTVNHRRLSTLFNDGRPTSIVWAAANGDMQRSILDSLFIDWNNVENKPSIGTVTSVGLSVPTAFSVSAPITSAGDITLTCVGSSTQYITGQGNLATLPTVFVPTPIAAGTRNFNQAYQLSSTNSSYITVSPQVSCAHSVSGGQSGTVTLEISPNGSTGWIFIGVLVGENTGSLSLGINTVDVTGCQLSTTLPPGYYWRLTTANVTGTPTYTFNGGAEIVY